MERLALEQAARTEQLAGRIMVELTSLGKLPDGMRLKDMSEAVMLAQEWCSTRDINGKSRPTTVVTDEVVERFRANIFISSNIRGGSLNHFEDSEIRAIIRAALASMPTVVTGEQPGWQPIESAPKDGQHFLACIAGSSFGFVGKRWPAIQTVVHWWDNPDEEGFYTSVNEMEPQRPFEATHWKPLDEPPAQPGDA